MDSLVILSLSFLRALARSQAWDQPLDNPPVPRRGQWGYGRVSDGTQGTDHRSPAPASRWGGAATRRAVDRANLRCICVTKTRLPPHFEDGPSHGLRGTEAAVLLIQGSAIVLFGSGVVGDRFEASEAGRHAR